MAKHGKGKLRAALDRHNARRQQAVEEAKRAEAREAMQRNKAASVRRGGAAPAQQAQQLVEPFAPDDTVLLVGETTFSFTLAVLRRGHPAHQMLATSTDTEDECYQRYPDAKANVEQIRALAGPHANAVVAFGVDVGTLHACDLVTGGRMQAASGRRWSKVWFGFPHVGVTHKDERRNVLANQLQLLRFFVSVAPFLTQGTIPKYAGRGGAKSRHGGDGDEDDEETGDDVEGDVATATASSSTQFSPPPRQGSILVTLRNAAPYTQWDLPMLAKKLRVVLPCITASAPALPKGQRAPTPADAEAAGARYTLWRSFEFRPDAWPGLTLRRSAGAADAARPRAPPAASKTGAHRRPAGPGEYRTWEFATVST